ncbi:MAG: co-chaperone GroES family protein [Gemmatimonadales bacterium]|nr:co-chaperone GroES family protein [Gemmatimonadales bacterium]
MPRLKKKLIVVGDRLLVRPEEGEERTNAGLYLPPGALRSRQAKGGWVVSVGPGVPVFNPAEFMDPSLVEENNGPTFVPMQAQEGDYVLFLEKAAVEITFEKKNYLIVPNSGVLVLVREDWEKESSDWEGDTH